VARRDTGDKESAALTEVVEKVAGLMDTIQQAIYERALAFREANTKRVDTWEEFEATFAGEGGAGFVVAHWDGTEESEAIIAERTKATIRCIPNTPLLESDNEPGVCVYSGKPSARRVVFAKAY